MSRTHRVHVSNGYYVTIVHCSECEKYLGVNYPSNRCNECKSTNEENPS